MSAMNKCEMCPNCSATETKRGKKNEWKNVMTPRACAVCGHAWEPAPPVWGMVLCVIGGGVGLIIAVMRFSFAFEFMPVRITMFGLGMLLVFGIGISGLVRREPKTLAQGRKV